MPITIQTNDAIKAVLKHKEHLVPISGYVAKTGRGTTTIYPGLDSSEWIEVPTASIRHAEVRSDGAQTLFVVASAKVQVIQVYDAETVRDNRQMASSQFENANQKATQYVNMLASVLKTMHEMQAGIIRNLG